MSSDRAKPVIENLSPHEIKKTPNSLLLLFQHELIPDNNFQVQATRLRESQSGRVQGEIAILQRNSAGSLHALIVPQGFDFSSQSYKENIARSMRYRLPEVNWPQVIDECCYISIKHIREGEPEVQIDSEKIEIKIPEYLLYPLLPRNQPSIIFGKKGSCKSTLALLLAFCVSTGWKDNPWFTGVATISVPVLWLDWETDRAGFEYDFKRLCAGTGRKPNKIYYQRCRGSLTNLTERLSEKINKLNIGLIIVDSIAPASGGEIKEAGTAIAYHDALRFFGKTSLSLGHPTKAESSSVTGAGQFEDLARNVWEVLYEQDEDSPTGKQALIHRKNYKTGYLKSIGFRYEFSDESITPNTEDPKRLEEYYEKARTTDRKRIIEYLKLGKASLGDIAAVLRKSTRQTSVTLNRMLKKSEVLNFKDELKWGLPYDI